MSELVDPTTLRVLSIAGISVLIAGGLCLLLLLTSFGRTAYQLIENAFSRLAAHRLLAASVLFLSVIGGRLLALPLLPVPTPGIHDEFSYLLIADTFAHGRLTNPTHPLWISFETFHVNWHPTYASMYPPAQGLILAIGQWLGHPWIGVLLSDAAMCVAVFWMLLAWMPSRWAFLGGVLVALKFGFTSYWVNSYWGGAVAAIGGALVLGALARLARRASVRDAGILGLGVAILANSRPYEGFFFCLPAAVWLIFWLAGKIKTKDSLRLRIRRGIIPLSVTLILTLCFMGYYNWRLTGDPLLMPHRLNTRTYYTAPMFLWQHAKAPLHYRNMAFQVFYNGWSQAQYHHTWVDVGKVSREKVLYYKNTFLWAGAQLLLPGMLFIFFDRKIWLLLSTLIVGAVASFAVIWSNSHYVAPLTCVIYAVMVQSMRHLRTMHFSKLQFGVALSRAIVLLLVVDTGTHLCYRVCDPLLFPCTGNAQRAAIVKQLNQLPGKHLVIVRYPELHNPHVEWVFNGADIDNGKVVWARELDPQQNEKLLSYFRDRRIWLIEPDKFAPKITPYMTVEQAEKR